MKGPAVRTFISSFGYLVGTSLLIPGTLFFFPSFSDYYTAGVVLYIVACSFLVIAAVAPLTNVIHQSWIQNVISVWMFLGGSLFLTASVLYYPSIGLNTQGTWTFRIGSCCYLLGSFFSLFNLFKVPKQEEGEEIELLINEEMDSKAKQLCLPEKYVWLCVILCYTVGAIMFIIGGVLSQAELQGFAATWMLGSILFSLGSLLAVIQTYICK